MNSHFGGPDNSKTGKSPKYFLFKPSPQNYAYNFPSSWNTYKIKTLKIKNILQIRVFQPWPCWHLGLIHGCRLYSGIQGLYPLDTRSAHPLADSSNSADTTDCLGVKRIKMPLVDNHCFREELHPWLAKRWLVHSTCTNQVSTQLEAKSVPFQMERPVSCQLPQPRWKKSPTF